MTGGTIPAKKLLLVQALPPRNQDFYMANIATSKRNILVSISKTFQK